MASPTPADVGDANDESGGKSPVYGKDDALEHSQEERRTDEELREDEDMNDCEKRDEDGAQQNGLKDDKYSQGPTETDGRQYSASPERPPQRTAVEERDVQDVSWLLLSS